MECPRTSKLQSSGKSEQHIKIRKEVILELSSGSRPLRLAGGKGVSV